MQSTTFGRLCIKHRIDLRRTYPCPKKGEHYNYEALLSCLYYDHKLKDTPELIDDICNRAEVYALAEQLANSGFGILKEWVETLDEEALCYKLISYMDKTYNDLIDDVNTFLV